MNNKPVGGAVYRQFHPMETINYSVLFCKHNNESSGSIKSRIF
jgi:hypothetical protein